MDALALIGWAFTAGVALAVFLLPCYILGAVFKDREKKAATPPPETTP